MIYRSRIETKCSNCKKTIDYNVGYQGNQFYTGYGSPLVNCPYCGNSIVISNIREIAYEMEEDKVPPKYKYEYCQSMARITDADYRRVLFNSMYIWDTIQYDSDAIKERLIIPFTIEEHKKAVLNAESAKITYIPDKNYPSMAMLSNFISISAKQNAASIIESDEYDDAHEAIKSMRERVLDSVIERYCEIGNLEEFTRENLGLYDKFGKDSTAIEIRDNGPSLLSIFTVFVYTLWHEKQREFLSKGSVRTTAKEYLENKLIALEKELTYQIKNSFTQAQYRKKEKNYADELRLLKELFDDGLISEEEYAEKKRKVLGL